MATGAALGLAAERYTVGRALRRRAGDMDEPLGHIRGETRIVLTCDGVPLHVEVQGEPGALPVTVVFCHGYALNQDAWHYQRRDLGDVGRLVFYDQRGHGRSGRGPKEHANVDQLGDDLWAVLQDVAPDGPVVLVGHSMGGMTVMALADQRPELFGDRVVGVALISTSPGKLAEVTLGVPAAIGRAARRVAPGVVEVLSKRPNLVERGRRMGSDISYLLTKRYSFASDVPPELVDFTAQMNAATPFEVVAEFFPAFDAHDKLAALHVLNGVETLILAGEGDLMTPSDHSRDMLPAVPGAELVIVPDAGHMVILEHHELVNSHLRGLVHRAMRSSAGKCA